MSRLRIGVLVLLGLVVGCSRVYNNAPTAPTRGTAAPLPISDTVEFRVFGSNVGTAAISFTDSDNGLTVVTGVVPYLASFISHDPSIFLYIQATAFGLQAFSTLQVQIFVNGKLFREGTSSGFSLSSQAYGTFTHHDP